MRLVLATCALALGVVLAGCSDDDPVEPPPLAGTYRLEQVNDAAIPAPIFAGTISLPEGDVELVITAQSGALVVSDAGRYEHDVALTVTLDGAPAPDADWHDEGTWLREGDELVFTSDFIENVTFRGDLADGTITVQQDLSGEGTDARYGYRRAP